MKKIFVLAIAAIAGMECFGQSLDSNLDYNGNESGRLATTDAIEKIDLVSCTDPEWDWSQYDEKTGKALVTKKGLELESKKDAYCLTYCELPIGMTDDNFAVRFVMSPSEISDDKPFGIVYDVENESNYRMLLVMKKSFQVLTVKGGEAAVAKKGVYKSKNKSKQTEIDLVREKDKIYFFINGLELLKMSSPKMENPMFGFVVAPKAKMICESFGFKRHTPQTEDEE